MRMDIDTLKTRVDKCRNLSELILLLNRSDLLEMWNLPTSDDLDWIPTYGGEAVYESGEQHRCLSWDERRVVYLSISMRPANSCTPGDEPYVTLQIRKRELSDDDRKERTKSEQKLDKRRSKARLRERMARAKAKRRKERDKT